MSQRLASSALYDEGLIDHRNARPLMIAFATIVGLVGALAPAYAADQGKTLRDLLVYGRRCGTDCSHWRQPPVLVIMTRIDRNALVIVRIRRIEEPDEELL